MTSENFTVFSTGFFPALMGRRSENARTLFCEALGILGFFIFWCELIQMPPFKFFYTTVLVRVCVRRWEYSKTEGFCGTDFRKKLFVDAFVYFCGEWFWCHHIIAPHKASKQAVLSSKLGRQSVWCKNWDLPKRIWGSPSPFKSPHRWNGWWNYKRFTNADRSIS